MALTSHPAELITNDVESEEEMLEAVRDAICAETPGRISQRGMIAATNDPAGPVVPRPKPALMCR